MYEVSKQDWKLFNSKIGDWQEAYMDHLTKADIISYLDFFINAKSSFDKYSVAVEKWKSDREFISKYGTGNYQTYRVGSISRKY